MLTPHLALRLSLTTNKNPSKNTVAERAVRELETELLRQEPLGRVVSPLTLAVATPALNSHTRSPGLSSRGMWTERYQVSNKELPFADDHLIALQNEQRLPNHAHSERSKAPLHNRCPSRLIGVGDIIYLHSDRNKSGTRDRYFVVAIDALFCAIKNVIGSQLRSSSYHVKLAECFKIPSDLADPSRIPRPCSGNDSDDGDHPDTTPHLSPPLPDIPNAISAFAQHLTLLAVLLHLPYLFCRPHHRRHRCPAILS